MPPMKCSYFRCENTSDMKSMFRFPNDDSLVKVWLDNSGNMNISHLPPKALRNRRLCIDHFDKKYIQNETGRRKRLQKLAIPEPYQAAEALERRCTLSSDASNDTCLKSVGGWGHFHPLSFGDKSIKNEEPTSENDTFHVFCPKCKTKVPHTAAGIQQDQTKILIAKVYHYFEQEYEELKKMYETLDLSPLSKIRQRTALATGVSDSMLEQILEEERQREADSARRSRAHKRRRHEDSSDDENTSDDSYGDAEADTDVQEPGQPYAADEPEIFVPAPLKTEPSDYDTNNEQVQTDPISLDIKTEPQEDEMEISIETQELIKPGTSKHKERKRKRKSQDTSTQSEFDGCKEELTSQDEMPTLTETGQVYACTCFMGCLNNRCLCNRKSLLCNPKCHYNVDCMNK